MPGTDPVCGMSVDPGSLARAGRGGPDASNNSTGAAGWRDDGRRGHRPAWLDNAAHDERTFVASVPFGLLRLEEAR